MLQMSKYYSTITKKAAALLKQEGEAPSSFLGEVVP
eukprot:SAG31_NODE_1359_length_8639_cov_3.889813_4_plen_36_part_00